MRPALVLLVGCWLLSLAVATVARNREWKDESRLYKSSLIRDPTNKLPHFYLAWHYSRAGDRERELDAYREVLRIKPNHLSALNNLGVRMVERGDYGAAREFLARAYRLNPTRAKTLYNIGFFHERQGHAEKALKWYRRALKSDPGSAMTRAAVSRVERELSKGREGS